MTPKIIEAMKGHRGARFVMLWIWLLVQTLVYGGVAIRALPIIENLVR